MNNPLPCSRFAVKYLEDPGIKAVSAKGKEIAASNNNTLIVCMASSEGKNIYSLNFARCYVNFRGDMFDIEHIQGEIMSLNDGQNILGHRSAIDDITNTLQLVDRIKAPKFEYISYVTSLSWLVMSHNINLDFLDELRKVEWYDVEFLDELRKAGWHDEFLLQGLRTNASSPIVDIRGADYAQNNEICKHLEHKVKGKYQGIWPMNVLVIADWLPKVPEDVDDTKWCYMETVDEEGELVPVFPKSRSRAKSARN